MRAFSILYQVQLATPSFTWSVFFYQSICLPNAE